MVSTLSRFDIFGTIQIQAGYLLYRNLESGSMGNLLLQFFYSAMRNLFLQFFYSAMGNLFL